MPSLGQARRRARGVAAVRRGAGPDPGGRCRGRAAGARPTFSRYELIRMINRHLPDYLGGLSGEQVTRPAGGADRPRRCGPAGRAEAVLLTAPEMVPVPEAYRRADGLSLWRRHGAEIYTTRAMLDTEARLLRAAAQTGAPQSCAGPRRRGARRGPGAGRGAAVARARAPRRDRARGRGAEWRGAAAQQRGPDR